MDTRMPAFHSEAVGTMANPKTPGLTMETTGDVPEGESINTGIWRGLRRNANKEGGQ